MESCQIITNDKMCGIISSAPHCEKCNSHHDTESCEVGKIVEREAHWEKMIDEMKLEDGRSDLTAIENHINNLKELVANIRRQEMFFQAKRNKVLSMNDAETVEQLRLDNPSAKLVRTVKKEEKERNKFEKSIIKWKKENFSTKKIVKLMKAYFEMEVTESYVEGIN